MLCSLWWATGAEEHVLSTVAKHPRGSGASFPSSFLFVSLRPDLNWLLPLFYSYLSFARSSIQLQLLKRPPCPALVPRSLANGDFRLTSLKFVDSHEPVLALSSFNRISSCALRIARSVLISVRNVSTTEIARQTEPSTSHFLDPLDRCSTAHRASFSPASLSDHLRLLPPR